MSAFREPLYTGREEWYFIPLGFFKAGLQTGSQFLMSPEMLGDIVTGGSGPVPSRQQDD